ASLLDKDRKRARLVIVGEPKNISTGELAEFGVKLGLSLGDELIIHPHLIDHPAHLLSRVDLGLISSTHSEIICRVAEEFLLCGTPVIVSGVGSLDEVLFDGAGESYHRDPKKLVEVLARWLEKSTKEGSASKQHRAD